MQLVLISLADTGSVFSIDRQLLDPVFRSVDAVHTASQQIGCRQSQKPENQRSGELLGLSPESPSSSLFKSTQLNPLAKNENRLPASNYKLRSSEQYTVVVSYISVSTISRAFISLWALRVVGGGLDQQIKFFPFYNISSQVQIVRGSDGGTA